MDINNTQNVNINTTTNNSNAIPTNNKSSKNNFATELEALKNNSSKENKKENKESNKNDIKNAMDGLEEAVNEINEVTKVNQKDENHEDTIKNNENFTDNKVNNNEENFLIDNNMNIQEQQELLNAQTSTNMNFNSNNQAFSEFINQENKNELKASAKDIAEEKAILSTMEENIAIANKNILMSQNSENRKTETIQNEDGIKKVNTKSHITVDTIVKYDNVVMDRNDVDFFVNLVEKGIVDLNEIQNADKASQVSKTLADLLAKSMNENKPIRIDFDNNISVIIKIDRTGKISAEFLPSSQVAEAYLKENLPLLRQRFDDSNIDYNQLSQRKQKQDNQENKKKGRKDE